MSNYWNERLDEARKIGETRLNAELAKAYRKAIKETQNDLNNLYIEIMESKKLGEEIKPLDLYRFRRFYDLQTNLNRTLGKLGQEEIAIYNKHLNKFYLDVYKLLPIGDNNISFTIGNQADEVVKKIWCADGKHWSSRIWEHKAELKERLQDGILNCVARGISKDKLTAQLMEDFGVGFSTAERITRTELSYVQNQSAIDKYKNAGIKEFEVLANQADDETCMPKNGNRFSVDEAMVGVNCPPFHPNCKCTVIPVVKEAY